MLIMHAGSRINSGAIDHELPLVVLVVRGSSDWVEPWLQCQVEDALLLRPEQLVIDLTHCEVLTPALLRLLLSAHRQVRRTDGRLTLRGLSPRLVRVIGLCGLSDVFDVEAGPAR